MLETVDGLKLSGGSTTQALTGTMAKLTPFSSNGTSAVAGAGEVQYGASEGGELDVVPDLLNNRLLLAVPGVYRIDVNASVLGAAAALLTLGVYVNGVLVPELSCQQTLTNGGTNSVSFTGILNAQTPGANIVSPLGGGFTGANPVGKQAAVEIWGSIGSNSNIEITNLNFLATRIG